MGLTLLVSGCFGGTGSFCTLDGPILPLAPDIKVMSDDLAMRIDAHDQFHVEQCR